MATDPIECPGCGMHLELSMKETLKPYSMTMKIYVEKGRMASAEAVGGVLENLSKALKAAGEELDHQTEVYLTDASVDEDMNVSLTVSAVPMRRAGEAAE